MLFVFMWVIFFHYWSISFSKSEISIHSFALNRVWCCIKVHSGQETRWIRLVRCLNFFDPHLLMCKMEIAFPYIYIVYCYSVSCIITHLLSAYLWNVWDNLPDAGWKLRHAEVNCIAKVLNKCFLKNEIKCLSFCPLSPNVNFIRTISFWYF